VDDPIDWAIISENRFNRVVEALIVREYTDETRHRRARAIDGRGGDRGIDIGIWNTETNEIVEILQLKWFLDGWPKRLQARRRQIKNSFDTAWREHNPPKWTLVTPRNPMLEELTYAIDLGEGKACVMEVMGPAELDAMFAKHEDLLRRFTTDYGRELLRDVGREEHALNRPGDLTKVLSKVYQQLQNRSDHWGSVASVDEYGNITEELRPLTSNAHEREPLTMSVTTAFSSESRKLQESFEDGLKHGITAPIVLGSHVIQRIDFDGPEWFARTLHQGEVTLMPGSAGEGLSASVTARDPNGRRLAGLTGTVKHIALGTESARVVLEIPGGLEMRWTLPSDRTSSGEIQFTTDFTGHRVRDIRKLTRFLETAQNTGQLELVVDGRSVAVTTNEGKTFEANRAFNEFLDDLIILENELDIEFTLPGSNLTLDDRVWARVAVRILQGVAVPFPKLNGFDFTLTGEPVNIEEHLEKGVAAFLVQRTEFAVELLGTEVPLGRVFIFQSKGFFDNGPDHAAALRAGDGAGRKVHIGSNDGLPFVVYVPDRLRGPKVIVTGWGIDSLPEHPKLEALRQLERERTIDMPGIEQARND
jgi:hypothetical protein